MTTAETKKELSFVPRRRKSRMLYTARGRFVTAPKQNTVIIVMPTKIVLPTVCILFVASHHVVYIRRVPKKEFTVARTVSSLSSYFLFLFLLIRFG
jgi:hypothetical protein